MDMLNFAASALGSADIVNHTPYRRSQYPARPHSIVVYAAEKWHEGFFTAVPMLSAAPRVTAP